MENYIFGIRPIHEALKAGKEIDKVLIKQNLIGELAAELLGELRRQNIQMQYVPTEKLDKVCQGNHQGIIAYIAPVAYQNTEDLITSVFERNKTPLVVILDSITDVRNFGAIARSCECAGVDAIIIPSKNSVRITEDALKTSAGALYNIPVCKEENLIDAIILLEQLGLNVIAITEKASDSIYQIDLKWPTAIIIGAEDTGISKSILKRVTKKAKIPMVGKTDSLNVSVAVAVTIYEAFRQRNS